LVYFLGRFVFRVHNNWVTSSKSQLVNMDIHGLNLIALLHKIVRLNLWLDDILCNFWNDSTENLELITEGFVVLGINQI